MISVIMPAYNCKEYIAQSIESILNQTYQEFELIIIDDGSKDETLSIATEYSKKDGRIKVYSIENGGPSNARNVGMSKASYPYLCFIDSDDCYDKHFLQIAYDSMMQHDADYFIALVMAAFKDSKKPLLSIYDTKIMQDQEYIEVIKTGVLNSPVVKLYKKALIDKHCLQFDTSLDIGEDLKFNLSYLKHVNTFLVYNEVLYEYIQNPNSITNRYKTEYFRKRKTSLAYVESFLNGSDEAKEFVAENKVKLLYALCLNYFSQPTKERYRNLKKDLRNQYFKDIKVNDFKYKSMYYLYKYNLSSLFICLNYCIYLLRKKRILKTVGTSI
ncbi:glycosyltransferase family 2 protein [Erysipelotrichaceae bacterium OH741_COT-311]|nr:glycosyltransferase family 2 protein [Erysipelotrichaceae bacterium OH741_COT-311]